MMKVKHIFSNRKTKKKKNQSTLALEETSSATHSKKLIISPSEGKARNAPCDAPSSDATEAKPRSESSPSDVVLRNKSKKTGRISDPLDATDPTKLQTSSTHSIKVKPRRPWSFIEQMRTIDTDETASSSNRFSHVPRCEDLALHPLCDDTYSVIQESICDSKAMSHVTLPRSLVPGDLHQRDSSVAKQYHASKRRTIDFKFFNIFKRSGAGMYSESSDGSTLNSSNRSSFRVTNKGKKKQGSKKKKDQGDLRSIPGSTLETSKTCGSRVNAVAVSVLPLDEDILQLPPSGLYDSDSKFITLTECQEPPKNSIASRVPENGESAINFAAGIDARHSFCDLTISSSEVSVKPQRRSLPIIGHGFQRMQCSSESDTTRPLSDSTGLPSRRSSMTCELSFPVEPIATLDSSACSGNRHPKLHFSGSVPLLSTRPQSQLVQRTRPNVISIESGSEQQVKSLSVANIHESTSSLSRSSYGDACIAAQNSTNRASPLQHRKTEFTQITANETNVATSITYPPPPVLQAIGYPGVVLRRNHNTSRRRPDPQHRAKLVMSLNVEDLPTYTSQPSLVREHVSGFPSCENILGESRSSSKRSSGSYFPGTASGRSRRRGATMSTHGLRRYAGFLSSTSVENLDSLSNSNFGSKQSLSQLDEDELLDALLSKRNALSHTTSSNLRAQEPTSKRAKAIRKSVVSLANLISPGKPIQKSKVQRSSSFKESGSSTSASHATAASRSFKPYRPPSNTPNKKKNRRSKLWCETFSHTGLAEDEIKRQEAIYELFQGERDLVEDLTMAKQTYRDSMVTLKMLSDEEVSLIFGKLECLLPLHEELLAKLEQARQENGQTLAIGFIFAEWFPRISASYQEYCANQSDAKYALDAAVEQDARVRDFLQRCLESPFSRKLDLWSYLDLPRTRLVKYPLLLQNVLKRTPESLEEERKDLNAVMTIIGNIIEKVDETTGQQQCQYFRSKLEYLDEKQKSQFVENSQLMLCSGQLKNNRGTKMHVFLFEEALVLTRLTTRSNKVSYQVYRHPLPLRSLVVDVNEGDKLSGSFKGGILSSDKVKHSFRVRSEELNVTYTLQASEEHDRKQWINSIQEALTKYRTKYPDMVMDNQAGKRNVRSSLVARSSSNKSNASSSGKSSSPDDLLCDDVSVTSENVKSWRRGRSQTVNSSTTGSPKIFFGSSCRSDESSEIIADKAGVFMKERLRRLQSDKPLSVLAIENSKRSTATYFPSGRVDKTNRAATPKMNPMEKERNKCQRSQSLTFSHQTTRKTYRSLFRNLYSSNNSDDFPVKKPPSSRASPSLISDNVLLSPGTLGQARSTPDLTIQVVSAELPSTDTARRIGTNDMGGSVGTLGDSLIDNATNTSVFESRSDKSANDVTAADSDDNLEGLVLRAPSDMDDALRDIESGSQASTLSLDLIEAEGTAGECGSPDRDSITTLISSNPPDTPSNMSYINDQLHDHEKTMFENEFAEIESCNGAPIGEESDQQSATAHHCTDVLD